jgi:hypothetical protein
MEKGQEVIGLRRASLMFALKMLKKIDFIEI